MKLSHPIVYIADEKYLHLLPANLDQISRFGAPGQLVYVVTTATSIPMELSAFGDKHPNLNIVFKQVVFEDYVSAPHPPKGTQVTKIALLKFFLPEILEEDCILYLDIDTLVCASIDSLLTYYPHNPIAAVEEVGTNAFLRGDSKSYFNSGVIVMSLQKIRDLGIYGQINNQITNKDFTYVDQDLFNIIFEGWVDFLPQKFNVFICNSVSTQLGAFVQFPTIIHFVGRDKPWKYPRKSKYSKLWIESFARATQPNPSSTQLVILRSRRGLFNISEFLNTLVICRVKVAAGMKTLMPKAIKDVLRNYI
jgi:hypothetical protein